MSDSWTWMSDYKITSRKNAKKIDQLWMNNFAPTSISDLAVHKAKITALENCMKLKLSTRNAPFLLITGPSGCGKTTAVNLVVKNLNAQVQEWTNPVTNESSNVPNEDFSYTGEKTWESQVTQFTDFLFRVNRYSSLDFTGNAECHNKIFLIKDFPNVFLRDPVKFHDIIKKYSKVPAVFPCIFIVTDTEQSSNLKRTLFPSHLLEETNIEVLKFNAIAPTSMMKALQNIANKASQCKLPNFTMPEQQILEDIVENSSGDIRAAINSLQFICMKHSKMPKSELNFGKRKYTKGKKPDSAGRERSKNMDQQSVGTKDAGISLFRALGKVLHCKRLDVSSPAENNLPLHLDQHKRLLLSFNPDEIHEKSCLSSEFFCAFLHQNYLTFCSDLDDANQISDYFSEADILMKEWSTKSISSDYHASLVTRGFAFSISAPKNGSSKKPGFVPLCKPQQSNLSSKMSEMKEVYLNNPCFSSCNTLQLSTEILPFCARIAPNSLNTGQLQFASNVGFFKKGQSSISFERFDEKDDVDIDSMLPKDTEDYHLCSDSDQLTTLETRDDESKKEEFFIEEVDD